MEGVKFQFTSNILVACTHGLNGRTLRTGNLFMRQVHDQKKINHFPATLKEIYIYKNLWRRKRVRTVILQNVEVRVEGGETLTLFTVQPLGCCVTCKGLSYAKDEHNFFYHKLDVI